MTTTVGDRVKLKQNNLKGTVKFIGEMAGKYGVWYGIELDKAQGSSNGSIRNVQYFKTKRNKGLFVKQYEIAKTLHADNPAPRCSVGDTVKIKKFNCHGTVRYIGGTDFKAGTWYGVELKKPLGKNNGTVKNRLYFACKYRYGAFVKADNISVKGQKQQNQQQDEHAEHKEQVQNVSVTINDTVQLTGDRLIGTIKFIGSIQGKQGVFYGIALKGNKGKNDGSVNNVRYFQCGKNKGVFVHKSRIQSRLNIIDSGDVRVTVGDTVKVSKFQCHGIVQFIGTPDGKKGIFYGVELKEEKGKNNGTVNGRKYFECADNFGIFVKKEQIAQSDELPINEVDGDDVKEVEESKESEETQPAVQAEEAEPAECDYKAPDVEAYVVDLCHVKQTVHDFSDRMKVDGKKYNGRKLLNIFDKIKVTEEELSLWGGYWGGKLFNGKADARSKMETVIKYAEKNSSCSKHIKQKLRVITKIITQKGTEKSSEYVHILLLIASHGNVCNVMKEVAIGNAYGLLTDKLDDYVQQQSLAEQMRKVLRDYRVLLVEKLFHSFEMMNNTHYIAGFHNQLAKAIGVTPYNDPNICTPTSSKCPNWKKGLDQRYFATLYTRENIIEHVLEQINEKKISYQKIVQFLQDHCPKDCNKMGFLQLAIDIDTGLIHKQFICWILEKLNVFMMKPAKWKPIEKCWD
eukprot:CAMPEP_0197023474 /NCGR_PEP_ID=MMETSP1384-20130603/4156_1 /TAXON_ID=29189 /ORGANISM="Ammonia sp." /LENGTH=683 /DNA_ID=CAMNT_0042451687 /DNA_START=1 /DNA_END=2052 /DNA_ORIENTATION=+